MVDDFVDDFYWNHRTGYFGEAAVHIILGSNWRLVFDYNDLRLYDHPDGVVNGFNFDVKTRIKNREGLSVKKPHYDFYVLVHYYDGLHHLVGYTTLMRLKIKKPNVYGNYTLTVRELSSIGDFVSRFRDYEGFISRYDQFSSRHIFFNIV